MSNKLTVEFSEIVGLVDYTDPYTGARYISFFTPNENGIEKANAGLGSIYISSATTFKWEPEPIVVPPPLPTSARYKVILPGGVNIRSGHATSYSDIGDLAFGDTVVVSLTTYPGTTYLWGQILSIDNPTPEQVKTMALAGEKWVALKNGSVDWLQVIPDA